MLNYNVSDKVHDILKVRKQNIGKKFDKNEKNIDNKIDKI